MKWTEVPAGQLHAAEQRLRVAFGDKADVIIEKINEDQKFAERIAGYAIQSVFDSPYWLRAREIMGKNFFDVEEAIKHFGVNPTRQQLAALSEIPFSEAVLEQLKDTYILVAVFPLSILKIREKVENKGLFFKQDWYNNQAFAREMGDASWQLVRKAPVDNSTSRNWQEQQDLLSKNDEVPTAQVMVYMIIGYYLATSERLFENIYVRTSSMVSGGRHVDVGDFDSGGLYVDSYSGDDRYDDLGLASSRKS